MFLGIKGPPSYLIIFPSHFLFPHPIQHCFPNSKMVAGEHDSQPTCLSEIGHTENIQNHVLHYLGCIERWERDELFKPGNDLYKHEYDHILQRLKEERNEHSQAKTKKGKGKETVLDKEAVPKHEPNSSKLEKKAKIDAIDKLKQWQKACDTEIRRIDYLRGCLARDTETKQLVQNIEETATKWKKSEQYKYLDEVKKWRLKSGRPNTTAQAGEPIASESQGKRGKYEPEKDYNLHMIEYEEKDIWDGESDGQHQSTPKKHHFLDNKKKIGEVFKETTDLKDPDANPLYKGDARGKLRYIHLPANNMTVSVC
jgi:hypothetical protein